MKSTTTSSSSRQAPFSDRHDLQLKDGPVAESSSIFNPTRARFQHTPRANDVSSSTSESAGQATPELTTTAQFQWRSRDNRKGRHTLVVPLDHAAQGLPAPTSSAKAVAKGIGRMFTTFPWWDVSFLVAFFFSVGCAVFIVCGFFYWLPLAAPDTEFPNESDIGGGIISFIGGTLFEIGAIFLMIEATNENQQGCFGWELEHALTGHDKLHPGSLIYKPEESTCGHHHCQKQGLVKGAPGSKGTERRWEWYPTWHELRTHYFHEIGFLGSFTEFVGASVFYINTILALPGIYNHLSQGVLWGLYSLTYLVGGVLFILSSALYMLETQPNWYTPAPHLLGWWVGVWNMVGSVGWTLAAALGYCTLSACEYQSDLTLIWASVAFLIGSLVLWYEALHKYPVEKEGYKS
ncbi:MAG: hypothetical protein M4579_000415 [Chaenotheca gracillima]|nr:MAG: hypothetical protein M4579_000415 [Chaenotheca gracillima]